MEDGVMVSQKQHEANKQNALLSTGPRSDEGKAMVNQNAMKHGIFSQEIVITKGDGKEDRDEYELLLMQLNDALLPMGKLEELLVEKIAVNYWRMRRLMRYETGQIRENIDNFKKPLIESYYAKSSELFDSLAPFYKMSVPEQPPMEYFHYSDYISEPALLKQEQKVGLLKKNEYEFAHDEVFIKYVLENKLGIRADTITEEHQNKFNDHIGSLTPQLLGKLKSGYYEIEHQKLIEMKEVFRWQKRFEILERIKNIPAKLEIEKIIKYENSLEKSIFRNLTVLRELQRSRQA